MWSEKSWGVINSCCASARCIPKRWSIVFSAKRAPVQCGELVAGLAGLDFGAMSAKNSFEARAVLATIHYILVYAVGGWKSSTCPTQEPIWIGCVSVIGAYFLKGIRERQSNSTQR